MKGPVVLATKSFPVGHNGHRVPLTMRVNGGLHYIRGASQPYFSLTYEQHRKGFPGQCYSGGCGHDYILKYYPQFVDLAALHLSGIDGEPMHAEATGWYNLAGVLGGIGEQYHVGNSHRSFPRISPPDRPWQDTEYRMPTHGECLQIFADHCRASINEARELAEVVKKDNEPRLRWRAIMDTMRPRWKAEADACIKQHGLVVFGDPWVSEPQGQAIHEALLDLFLRSS